MKNEFDLTNLCGNSSSLKRKKNSIFARRSTFPSTAADQMEEEAGRQGTPLQEGRLVEAVGGDEE